LGGGGSAKGQPANDDTLLRKAWIYSLFIKANTHSQAHSRWLGGRATKVARATELDDFSEIDLLRPADDDEIPRISIYCFY
jgi:hypothetical protein